MFALLLCMPVITSAQNTDRLADEYFNLKSKQTTFQGRGTVKPDLILLSSTQKFIDGTAKIRFTIEGKLTEQNIQIQPLQVVRDSAGKITDTVLLGEATAMRVRSPKNQAATEIISNPEILIPVDVQANAIEIRLNFEKDGLGDRRLLLPLSEALDIVGLRIFQPIQSSNFGGGCDCPFVELTNSRCGTVDKFCGGLIKNALDGTNCTVTCGSTCKNKDCVAPVGGDES